MVLYFSFVFSIVFFSKISSDLEHIDVVFMNSFPVALHFGLFVKCHSA